MAGGMNEHDGPPLRSELREFRADGSATPWSGTHYMRGKVRVVHMPEPRNLRRQLRNLWRSYGPPPLAIDGAAYRRRTRRRRRP